MWQLEWATEPAGTPPPESFSRVRRHPAADQFAIDRVGGLMWEEHCHECAAPDCYSMCPLYSPRADGKCARFDYGIYANPEFAGLFPFGADVRFRRWAKLESVIPVGQFPARIAPQLARADRLLAKQARRVDVITHRRSVRRRMSSAYGLARLKSLSSAPTTDFDEFVVEAWSPEEHEFRLAVECRCEGSPYFRESIVIQPGWNRVTFPAAALLSGASSRNSRMLVYPEADATVRIIFTWLDFVRHHRPPAVAQRVEAPSSAAGADTGMVKVVVWDLDGTMWDGILADVGADALTLAPETRALIEELDARGILQSVASKNDFDSAWGLLTTLGLDRMFLYPSIHWGPKSESIRQIASSLNLGLDSIAFIDDSEVERAQVRDALPSVRVYPVEDLPHLLTKPGFDVKPSEEGRRRRLSYLAEMERQQVLSAATSEVSIEDFLRSCAIEVALTVPSDDAALDRCHELLLRSNQLNLSTRRYSRDELAALLGDSSTAAVAISVKDRFGDYGLVGFSSVRVDSDGRPRVEDLVFSCRVAKKTVENAVLEALRPILAERSPVMALTFIPTPRNAPLLEALHSAGLREVGTDATGGLLFELDTSSPVPLADVVSAVAVDRSVADRLRGLADATSSPARVPADQPS